MALLHEYLFPAMWVCYLVYWQVASGNVKMTERTEAASSRWQRLALLTCAIALLWLPRVPLPFLNHRFLPRFAWSFWAGAAVTAAGLIFSVWGRLYLGTNWSQAVTLKEGHELITSGPYALVRHPIYAGLLLGFVGCAIALGQWRGVLAVALVFIALWRKLQLEENWMRQHFGELYESYARRVSALVPYVI